MEHKRYRNRSCSLSSSDSSDDSMPELESIRKLPNFGIPCIGRPMNAYFDGDEINLFCGTHPDLQINPSCIKTPDKNNVVIPEVEELAPDDILNNFLELFDLTKFNHVNFKNLCASLNVNNEIHVKIKEIIMSYVILQDFEIEDIIHMVSLDIYNNDLTDFTINFPDGRSLKCLKIVLQTIPYFDMIFQEFEMQDSIDLTTDYELISLIIKLLYTTGIDEITIFNFVDLIILMDKYLMKDYFNILLEFAKNNMVDIIEYLLDNKKLDTIQILYEILNNIKTDPIHKKNASKIIEKIFSVNFGENIMIFKNWAEIFSDNQKIEAIKLSNNYNLLNISKISPKNILPLLANINFPGGICNKLYNEIENYGSPIFFAQPIILLKQTNANMAECSNIIIKNYYPMFEYTFVRYVPIKIIEKLGDLIIINLTKYSRVQLSVNSKIMFSDNDNTYCEDVLTPYTITKIFKYYNNKQKEVSDAEYVSPKIFGYVSYGICLDTFLDDHKVTNIWSLEYGYHDVMHC